jgi:transcriptional regulator GlxA family with amidase domain
MSDADTRIHVAILAMPEVTASTLYGMLDLFAAVGRDWGFLVAGAPGPPKIAAQIVAREKAGFRAANNVWILPDASIEECSPPSIVCIPDFFVDPREPSTGGLAEEIAWLRQCHAAGATIASACSGAFLLAETGLIDGLEATTHWAYGEGLAARHPKVRVNTHRTLLDHGADRRIVMAGGATTWLDLTLYLIARFVGLKDAIEVAKIYLVEWHASGQTPFAAATVRPRSDDRMIAGCQEWAASNYAQRAPVAAMVAMSGLAERSFNRRFFDATGMSPMDYVHRLRIEEAKQMLETGDLPVEAIANDVGYEDASFLGRLFRRLVGVTPLAYRRRFAALRESRSVGGAGLDSPLSAVRKARPIGKDAK